MEGAEVTRVQATRTHKEGRTCTFPSVVAILNASPPAHSDHPGGEDNPTGSGGPPAIDLGPAAQPESTGNDANPKPDAHDPGEHAPPHNESKDGIEPNVGDVENKSADAVAQPKPGPDPAAGKGTPNIPVFLGPSNSNPPPGSSGPPSDAPQDSGFPSDEETSCGGPFGESLINLMSNNGGDGGDASSGTATRQEKRSLLVRVSDSNMF